MNNFHLERELAERSEKDWIFGARSEPSLVLIPETERDEWLPKGELQFDSKIDFTDCASRSPVNHFEALFSYHYAHGMKPENKKWLEDNEYIQDGKVTFSDRFIAVLSGTTRNGNSLKSPLEAIRTKGLIPKRLLPKEDWMDWDDYYDPNKITQILKDLGQEFIKRFGINYEQVPQQYLAEVLGDDMVGVAAYAWPIPVEGVYPRVDGQNFNHAFLLYRLPRFQAFDNYYDKNAAGADVAGDFTKTLAPDYVFYDYGYRAYISRETVVLPNKHVFMKNLELGSRDPEVGFLQNALLALGYSIPHATTETFGPETKAALAAFQKDCGINDDGSHFGPQTRLALNKKLVTNLSIFDSFILIIRTFIGI